MSPTFQASLPCQVLSFKSLERFSLNHFLILYCIPVSFQDVFGGTICFYGLLTAQFFVILLSMVWTMRSRAPSVSFAEDTKLGGSVALLGGRKAL